MFPLELRHKLLTQVFKDISFSNKLRSILVIGLKVLKSVIFIDPSLPPVKIYLSYMNIASIEQSCKFILLFNFV
jgi:hypothetical protein